MAGQYIEPMPLPAPVGAWTLPSQCAVCRGWARARLCDACVQRFAAPRRAAAAARSRVPAGQSRSAAPACASRRRSMRALAAVDYGSPWDTLIAALQVPAGARAGPGAGRAAAGGRARQPPRRPRLAAARAADAARLRERGYNQAWEMARASRARSAAGRCPAAAAHARHAAPDRACRWTGARPTCAAPSRSSRCAAREIAGRASVALVDDVMTTGATAAEMARVLLHAGARSVQVWVLARTPRPDGA